MTQLKVRLFQENNYQNPTTMKLVKAQESYIDVANIIILDKSQRL